MRSDAKAPSAGSNLGQATGLGRIFRGADATGGITRRADGSNACSRSRVWLAFATALALTAIVAMTAPVASAAVTTEYVKSFGPDGTEATDFERVNGVAVDQQTGVVYALDVEAGALYKFEADGTPLDWGGSAAYISGNQITGLVPYTEDDKAQVAVDSDSHVVYVTEQHSVRAFQENGEPAEFTAGPGAGTSEIPGFGELSGVTVDNHGAIYASDATGTVSAYASTGEALTSFATTVPGNLAVASDGTLYVAKLDFFEGGVHEFIPGSFPLTGPTTYTPGSVIKPDSTFTVGVGVDPILGDVYIPVWGVNDALWKYDSDGNFVRHFGAPGEEGDFQGAAQGVAVVGYGEEFQFYAGDPAAGQVKVFGEAINPGPPSVVSTSAADVTSSSATLKAEINPNTFATTYRFEYGLGDCAVSACTSVPLAAVGIGAGHHPVAVTQHIAGLQPGATYHYRVIAENSQGVVEGPGHTLTTQVSGLGFGLPDNRAWEMVSPPNKHGGSLALKTGGIVQASEDGEGIAYLSTGSIEPDPDGNRSFEPSSVLSRRGAGGWSSKDITPPHTEAVPPGNVGSEFSLFDTDLSRALMEARNETPLSPQASERTFYLRENTEPAIYTPLVTGKEGSANVPPGTKFGGENFDMLGANPALTDAVFSSFEPLIAGAPSTALYRWRGGLLHPVSQLPSDEGGGWSQGSLGSDQGTVRGAVSEDGSRVFWGAGQYNTAGVAFTALYLRDTVAEESVRLDVVQPGAGGAGEPRPAFQGASADGTVVFFTDSRDLTADSSPDGRDLYRCKIPSGAAGGGCASLLSVSAPPPGQSALVKDLALSVSDDGSRIYFVAEGALDADPNEQGDAAIAGEPNLYLWQDGQGLSFIATLSPNDQPTWGASSGRVVGYWGAMSAAASSSGRYLAFMSEGSLTGYENRDGDSEEPTQQAFRYDAETGELACVSCNPTGGRPDGELSGDGTQKVDRNNLWDKRWVAAILPEASADGGFLESLYGPRYVLDNGRVFFNAVDGLVPSDSNAEWDVYQYESTGVGDCTASSGGASISRSGDGCVSLISSGTSEEEAAFLDSSTDGEDVFFLTRAKLSVLDTDTAFDVYDARVDGVTATLLTETECQGETCLPAAVVPNDPTPSSAAFRGEGNLEQKARKRCAKGKRLVRRKGKARCVARKQSKRQERAKRKQRAGKERRASR